MLWIVTGLLREFSDMYRFDFVYGPFMMILRDWLMSLQCRFL